MLPSWSRIWSKSENTSTRWWLMKLTGSCVDVFELAFERAEDILNTDFKHIWLLHFDSNVVTLPIVDSSCFGEISLNLLRVLQTYRFTEIWLFVCSWMLQHWYRIWLKSDLVCWSSKNVFNILYLGLFPSSTHCRLGLKICTLSEKNCTFANHTHIYVHRSMLMYSWISVHRKPDCHLKLLLIWLPLQAINIALLYCIYWCSECG